jgi:hypothetical protein
MQCRRVLQSDFCGQLPVFFDLCSVQAGGGLVVAIVIK